MFTKSNNMNKVKFQAQESDDYLLENSVLKSKLQSKVEALIILSRELDKCSMERDRFKVLVEQFKLKKSIKPCNHDSTYPYQLTTNKTVSGGELLAFTREENNILKLEVESLRTKLEDAAGDIDALRKQLQFSERNLTTTNIPDMEQHSAKDYELLVQDLERTQKKCQQIMREYQLVLDEKEELIADRDYYKNKVFRLNHQISLIVTNRVNKQQSNEETLAPKLMIDIDAVIAENKYLQERITQLQVEKEIAKRNLSKYKSLLENKTKTTSNLKMGVIDVMTQKQVKEFLDQNLKSGLKKTSLSDLKSLCMGLFEALSDKSIALQHQRKTNQILANRITELEKTLENWCNGEKYVPIFPSQMLLNEFICEPENYKNDGDEKFDNQMIHDAVEAKKNRLNCKTENNEYCEDTTETKSSYCEDSEHKTRSLNKTILPLELEALVREALAELKPDE